MESFGLPANTDQCVVTPKKDTVTSKFRQKSSDDQTMIREAIGIYCIVYVVPSIYKITLRLLAESSLADSLSSIGVHRNASGRAHTIWYIT